jgi:hypothetical protein
MDLPRITPVGLLELPGDFEASPRRFPRALRILAGLLVALFLTATIATGAVSLGRYCLTTDAADTRALPGGLRPDR